MPSNYTQHYNLNQWEPEDQVRRVDFNADNAKIDTALAGLSGELAGKADQAALEEEIAARKAADGALSTTLSSHAQTMTGLGNCQIYSVSYTGKGEDRPQSLTFPDRPVIVYLMHGGGVFAPCVYGDTMSRTVGYNTLDTSFQLSWSGNTLSWAAYAMNNKGGSYQAIALCIKS